MKNIVSLISEKIIRKVIDLSLFVIKIHLDRQVGLYLYVYNRDGDSLTPITWKARGITKNERPQDTNDWKNLQSLIELDGKIVVDVGASLGMTAVYFAKYASLVYALEPHPRNYEFMLDQLRIRRVDNVKPYNLAVSDFDGQADLFERESHGIHSLGVHNKGRVRTSFPVPVVKLDDFWEQEINKKIGLLKIDVEGFECDVLSGAKNLLRNKQIEAVVFEFSPRIHKLRGMALDAPLNVLQDCGYHVYSMDGEPFLFNPKSVPKICDLIALPA